MSFWRMMQPMFMLVWLMLMSMTEAYPVESKPLNNNPDTWNFGEGWLIFNPRNAADPSASALIGADPHIKKSKITPKSIFIAPNAYNTHAPVCPHGFRIDDNGKCIKIVTINQDEILAARISELFGVDDQNPNKNSDIDSDYYDFDDESKSEKDPGPLQFNLPLAIDIDDEDVDGKKVEYVIEEKLVTMRNLSAKDLTTTEKPDETTTTTAAVTEITESVSTEEPITSSTVTTETVEETITTTETMLMSSSMDDEVISTTMLPTTVEPTTITTTEEPTTTVTSTTTAAPTTTTTMKIFSVDFLPKTNRKSNRMGQTNARLQNSRDRDKVVRPRKHKTTAISTKSNEKSPTKVYKIERDQSPKKNRTRGSKRPGNRKLTTTTEAITTLSPVNSSTATQKPFWWLPPGWTLDQTKEKPVLVRFWAQQPLQHDERARSSQSSRQRQNNRMPTDNIFQEVTASELESVLQK